MSQKVPLQVRETALSALYGFLCGFFFYRNMPVTLCFMAVSGASGYISGRKTERKERRDAEEDHFFEFLSELSEALDAGNNIINALKKIYPGLPEGRVREKLKEASARLSLNYTADEVFRELSEAFEAENIRNWAVIIAVSIRNGANLQKAIRENRDLFVLRRRMRREIKAIFSRQKFNLMILRFMPFLILALLLDPSYGFGNALYSASGRIIMTAALSLILFSNWVSGKIVGNI